VVLRLTRPFLVTLNTLLEVRRGGVLKAVPTIAHPRSLTHNPAIESSLDHCAARKVMDFFRHLKKPSVWSKRQGRFDQTPKCLVKPPLAF
jgi:hypothetical protein